MRKPRKQKHYKYLLTREEIIKRRNNNMIYCEACGEVIPEQAIKSEAARIVRASRKTPVTLSKARAKAMAEARWGKKTKEGK